MNDTLFLICGYCEAHSPVGLTQADTIDLALHNGWESVKVAGEEFDCCGNCKKLATLRDIMSTPGVYIKKITYDYGDSSCIEVQELSLNMNICFDILKDK